MGKFNDWINKKYIDWRGDAYGHERTVTEFAEEYVGVSQQLMTEWMKPDGPKPRNQNSISKLVARFGLKVYDILDIELSDTEHELWEFRFLLQVLTPEERETLKQKGYMMLSKEQQAEMRARLKSWEENDR